MANRALFTFGYPAWNPFCIQLVIIGWVERAAGVGRFKMKYWMTLITDTGLNTTAIVVPQGWFPSKANFEAQGWRSCHKKSGNRGCCRKRNLAKSTKSFSNPTSCPTGSKVPGERNPRSQQLKRADSISRRHRNPDIKIHRLSSLHMYSYMLKHACPTIYPSCYISGSHILWLYCNRKAAVAAAVANIRTLDFCQMRKKCKSPRRRLIKFCKSSRIAIGLLRGVEAREMCICTSILVSNFSFRQKSILNPDMA